MNSLEQRIAEGLARAVDRRRLLKRSVGLSFGVLAGAGVGGAFADTAAAHTKDGSAYCSNRSGVCTCDPPHRTFCSGCSGHDCPSGYSFTDQWGYASACWCTAGCGNTYYICCDCHDDRLPITDTSSDCGCGECVGTACGTLATEMGALLGGATVNGMRMTRG